MNVPATSSARAAIDWAALRQRADAALALLDPHGPAQASRRTAVLRERARLAAREPAAPPAPGVVLELVEFSLLHESYGVEAASVLEVAHLDSYLPLPGAPAFVLGVVPLRGRMLTIINLKPFFELPERGLTNLNKIVVLREGVTEFGLLADAVSGRLLRVREDALEPLPPTLVGPRAQFSRGIAPDSVVVLDARRLLRDPRFNAGGPSTSA